MAKPESGWIQLFFVVDDNSEFMEFEESMRAGKKGHRARRTAEDVAFARVVRLYLLLGRTDYGRIDMKSTGDRLLAEKVMRESGDDLMTLFDQMSSCGVINRDLWESLKVVETTNAVKQAERRRGRMDKSAAANEAKRRKAAKKNQQGNLQGDLQGDR